MQRPPGVTASLVVCGIGSVLALVMAMMFAASAYLAPFPDPNLPRVAIAMAVVAGILGGVGLWTSYGLYHLRSWARTSILAFAAVMSIVCGLALVVALLVPLPPMPDIDAQTLARVRHAMLGLYGVPLLIGVWWLVEFNRSRTKEAFAATEPLDPDRLPISITLIGWFNVIGGIITLAAVVFRTPAFVAGMILTGWKAALVYTFMAAVSIFLGRGILRLDERARILTIGWFGITILHSAFIALSPAARARIRDMQLLLDGSGAVPAVDSVGFTLVMLSLGIVLFAAAIWPLFTHKARFAPRD